MKVTVVFDREFGNRPQRDLGEAYWIVDPSTNRPLVDQLKRAEAYDPNSASFQAGEGPPPADDVWGLFDTVALHHPTWSELVFVGASPPDDMLQSLGSDRHSLDTTPDGFVVKRT